MVRLYKNKLTKFVSEPHYIKKIRQTMVCNDTNKKLSFKIQLF